MPHLTPSLTLFENHRFRTGTNYDITPDGQRFVMVRAGGSEAYTAVVVLNFSEQLRRVVPD